MDLIRWKSVQLEGYSFLDPLRENYVYGLPSTSSQMNYSTVSIESAYEVVEDNKTTEVLPQAVNDLSCSRRKSSSRQFLSDLLSSKSKKPVPPLLKVNRDFYVPHPENDLTEEKQKLAEVVHDLVFEKYEQKYNILLRKLQKTHFTEEDKKYIDVVDQLRQSFSIKEDMTKQDSEKIANRGLPKKPWTNLLSGKRQEIVSTSKTFSMNIIQDKESFDVDSQYQSVSCNEDLSSRASSTYDADRFLDMALGDGLYESLSENYIEPPTVSINSSDISYLLSISAGSFINKTRKLRSKNQYDLDSLYNVVVVNSTSYECITNFYEDLPCCQSGSDTSNQIFIQETISSQLLHLLEYCRKKFHGFIGSPEHLEAERMLILSKIKGQVLRDLLHSVERPINQITARITLNNVRCYINSEDMYDCPLISYYVVVLRHHDTVHVTKIAKANRLGWIDFTGPYVYRNATNTFKIKGELYAIQFNNVSSKRFKHLFTVKTPKVPMMKLIGETYINLTNAANAKFTFRHVEGYKYKFDKLAASVKIMIQWPGEHKGFLTVGTERPGHQVLWNRKWCILKKDEISCYTFPGEENYSNSRGTIHLNGCISCEEVKNIYPKKRSLLIRLNNFKTDKIMYVTPDTQQELQIWKEKINLIIKSIADWNITNVR